MQDEQVMKSRMRVRASEALRLDEEAAAVLSWLKGVCERSELAHDQMFIFRDMGRLNKLIKSDRRGEIKAIGMSDLLRVSLREFRSLQRMKLITLCKGRWPGKWFTVNFEQP